MGAHWVIPIMASDKNMEMLIDPSIRLLNVLSEVMY